MGQPLLQSGAAFMYHKVGQALLQSVAVFEYHKVEQLLLQSGAVITKWGRYFKGEHLLQSSTVHLHHTYSL